MFPRAFSTMTGFNRGMQSAQKPYRNNLPAISLAAAILGAVMLLSSIAIAASDTTPPDTQGHFRFTYHSEIGGIDPKANHIEAWIPLPRED